MANLLATCATKLTVNGTTTAPEHLMVCGSGRFVASGGTPTLYFGTSHGSVDITLQRTASKDFKIATYFNSGNNTALRIYETCVYACTCLQSPTLCATSKTYYGACNAAYICSNGTYLYHQTAHGFIQFGPGNASFAHINTDRSQFYFNKKLVVNCGQVQSYDNNLILQRMSSATARILVEDGTTNICQFTKVHGCICATSNIQTAGKIHICSAHNCLHMASTCDAANYNFTICSMYNWACSLNITNRCIPILKACFGNCVTSLWGNNTERICLHPTGTKIVGNLCVTGTVTADGMEGDTLVCADTCTGTICFNTSCATGLDAVYDIYVSANPNCGGSTQYRDIVHLTSYVTTGWNGSAVTKYINTINKFTRDDLHGSGASTVTATAKLLVGTTGADSYASACATCLQVQVSGGSSKNNTCVIIKKVL
jgi:hypothetical protein